MDTNTTITPNTNNKENTDMGNKISIHPTDQTLRVRMQDGVVIDLRGNETGEVINHPSYNNNHKENTTMDNIPDFDALDSKVNEALLAANPGVEVDDYENFSFDILTTASLQRLDEVAEYTSDMRYWAYPITLIQAHHETMADLADKVPGMTDDELDELFYSIVEDGAEIARHSSAYEYTWEHKYHLATATEALNFVQAYIDNNKEKENTMNKCYAITKKGEPCKARPVTTREMLVNGIEAIVANPANVSGYLLRQIPVCKAHNKPASLKVQSLRNMVDTVVVEEKKEVKKMEKSVKCGNCKEFHANTDEVRACYGAPAKAERKNTPFVQTNGEWTNTWFNTQREAVNFAKTQAGQRNVRPAKNGHGYWVGVKA